MHKKYRALKASSHRSKNESINAIKDNKKVIRSEWLQDITENYSANLLSSTQYNSAAIHSPDIQYGRVVYWGR
jgi:hypothetical protein